MPGLPESPTQQAQIENLCSIIRTQQLQINRLHTALVGHQNIFEALFPAAALAAARAGKTATCATSN